MSQSDDANPVKKVFNLLSELAAFLLFGTAVALVWANIDYESYHHFIEDPLFHSALLNHSGDHGISFHFLVNDMFMVLFFGIAAKEVSESFLPGGALSSLKKASMPAVATAGGVLGPIGLFFILHSVLSPDPAFDGGWAIPTATDIAYCWLFAGMVFGRAHPAVTFLLVLAVLDDLIGMLIIATVYTPEVHPQWLGLVVLALVICEGMRRFGVKSYWPYVLIGGPLCWFGLHNTGVHAALALVPVIPFMPHAERDSGLFQSRDEDGDGDYHNEEHDTMNNFEHAFKPFVDVGLLTFGLANAGVVLSMEAVTSTPTWIILLSLLVGKTVGIFAFCFVGNKLGLELPEHVTLPQTVILGLLAGIGFTVALFVTTVYVGISNDPALASIAGELKLGALLSFAAGPLGFLLAKFIHVDKIEPGDPRAAGGHH